MSEFRGRMSRDDVLVLVRKALQSVADISESEPIEQFVFNRFHAYHKMVFLTTLRALVCSWQVDESRHYTIGFNENDINGWPTVRECVDWVYERKGIETSNTKKLKKNDLESGEGG